MKYLKKFENFQLSQPSVKPARPEVKPDTRPSTRPSRPSPIRRDKPAVEPDPKAIKDKDKILPKATIEDVIEKFAKLTNQKI
jgi:hypothetical protein